jgi:phthalate 4,5-cis-dihydrodiol dehydrogenase
MTKRQLRVGVAGLGKAFMLMLPGLAAHPNVALAAAADPRPEARARFTADFCKPAYESVEELCADAEVEAVYVATPHQFHAAHVAIAACHGKHVLVEKPMALTLGECRDMIEAVSRARVHMVIGHSHSFDAPIARTRALIARGTYGRLRMITAMNFTDFLYRPRRPEELDTQTGGGVLFNQAPHHVDVMRLLADSPVKSVRAVTGAWDARRATEGAYSALLNFEDGVFASLVYSGYAHFDSDEFMDWIAESGLPKDPTHYGAARTAIGDATSGREELALKQAQNYGAPRAPTPAVMRRWHQQFGPLIVSCEGADLRPMPNGIAIYADTERRFEPIPEPISPRREVIDEFCDAVFDGKAPKHDGPWGMATMEVCLAMLQSAREQREIMLQHQARAS